MSLLTGSDLRSISPASSEGTTLQPREKVGNEDGAPILSESQGLVGLIKDQDH